MRIIEVGGCKSCPYNRHEYYRGYFMWAKCYHPSYWKEHDYEKSYVEIEEDELNSYGRMCPLKEV